MRAFTTMTLCLAMAGLTLGCGGSAGNGGITVVPVWCHQGQEAENTTMRAIAQAFNDAHQDIRVELTFFPDNQYSEKISASAAIGEMPDALIMDGPLVAQYADSGLLQPLSRFFEESELEDFLETILEQGTYQGQLFALGAFESAVAIYINRAKFAEAGVAVPEPETSLRWGAFLELCGELKSAGQQPIAMHMDESADEWYTYAFLPLVWSGGGRLIDEDGNAEGALNAPETAGALSALQILFSEGYASTDPVNPDPFGAGETAMDWNGHWRARAHAEALGENLAVMLLPRLSGETVAPSGSWCWGVSSAAKNPAAAAEWVRWVTAAETGVVPIVKANGAIPARKSAFAMLPEFQEHPYKLFEHQLREFGRPRPRTPVYGTLSAQFAAAFRDIMRGADPQARLDKAAADAQRVIDRQ